MKESLLQFSLVFICFSITSCFSEEVLSDTPVISFKDLKFIDTPNNGVGVDTLKLTFDFTDGGGNLWLEDSDFLPPVNEFNIYLDSNDVIVTDQNVDDLTPPFYLAPLVLKKFIPLFQQNNELTTIPIENGYPIFGKDKVFYSDNFSDIPFECPGLINQDEDSPLFGDDFLTTYYWQDSTECFNQLDSVCFADSVTQLVQGVVPVEKNEFFDNLIIAFKKKISGEFIPINFQAVLGTEDCSVGQFSARVPFFDSNAQIGTISYNMQSNFFRNPFADDTIRIDFFVIDRAGNRSNIESSKEFVLRDITQ